MTLWMRLEHIFLGLFMVVCGTIMMLFPLEGYKYVTLILSLSLMGRGIGSLAYYFILARHMVDGRFVLYIGVFIFDFGVFTLSMIDIPRTYVMMYLWVIHAFWGLINILHALESRRMEAPAWRMKYLSGLVNIVIALFCIIFVKSMRAEVYFYSLGLVYSGCVHFLSSFRNGSMVEIQ